MFEKGRNWILGKVNCMDINIYVILHALNIPTL